MGARGAVNVTRCDRGRARRGSTRRHRRARAPRGIVAPSSTHPRDRGEPAFSDPVGIQVIDVREGHDRGDGQATPFHDEALAGRGLVEDLAEAGADVEGADRSHGTIIGP